MRKIFLFSILFFGTPVFVSAQVVINEIAWMGTEVKGVDARQQWRYEWLELYNNSKEPVSLAGWSIELYREKLDFMIPLYGDIAANEFLLVSASNSIPDTDINYGSLAGKFANSGQRVVLKNGVGDVVEEIQAQDGWFAGDNEAKTTMERRFPEKAADDSKNWGSSTEIGGTPKTTNSVFKKEALVSVQGSLESLQAPKKDSLQSSLVASVSNTIFLKALGVALLFAGAMVLLRRYLLSQDEDSFDAHQD